RMRRRYEELCEQLGVEAKPPGTVAGQLAVADQQLLEVMRALQVDANVVLFDEPTASLAEHERDAVLSLMKNLRSHGITVVFVSPRREVGAGVGADVRVFGGGVRVAWGRGAGGAGGGMVDAMLGEDKWGKPLREMEQTPPAPSGARRDGAARTPILRAEGITLA